MYVRTYVIRYLLFITTLFYALRFAGFFKKNITLVTSSCSSCDNILRTVGTYTYVRAPLPQSSNFFLKQIRFPFPSFLYIYRCSHCCVAFPAKFQDLSKRMIKDVGWSWREWSRKRLEDLKKNWILVGTIECGLYANRDEKNCKIDHVLNASSIYLNKSQHSKHW